MFDILIADDEEIENLVLKKKIAKFYGNAVSVRTAANGRAVRKSCIGKMPDLLILDIAMPGMSGLEAAEEIRKTDRKVQIVFLTAFDDFSYAKRAISLHALDYLLKPVDERELCAVIDEAVRLQGEKTAAAASDAGGQKVDDANEIGDFPDLVQKLISERYGTDLSVETVAAAFGYSEGHFCKLFKQYFGISFVSYLTEYRISAAERLLLEGDLSVREICEAVGYEDANYFSKVFRRIAGKSPSEFRENGRQMQNHPE